MIKAMKHSIIVESPIGKINLRPYTISDVSFQIEYLYGSPSDFLYEIGFEPSKFPGRQKHQENIEANLRDKKPGDFNSVVAESEGEVLAIIHLQPGEKPRAHFHIIKEKFRGRGLGKPILLNSLRLLMTKHNLITLRIEPKEDNLAMKKLMEKCGFAAKGKVKYPYGPVTREFNAISYLVEFRKIQTQLNIL